LKKIHRKLFEESWRRMSQALICKHDYPAI
jgi:hypothetical protein